MFVEILWLWKKDEIDFNYIGNYGLLFWCPCQFFSGCFVMEPQQDLSDWDFPGCWDVVLFAPGYLMVHVGQGFGHFGDKKSS